LGVDVTLDPGQVKAALAGLAGWQYEDGALVRGVPVTDDGMPGLVEALRNASTEGAATPEVHIQPDLLVLRVGDPAIRGVTADDVEMAARIDQVLSGSASDQGS
jgi:pterin-4a-carbinolamine dehydratase